jgi:hypothetical protein
MTYELAKQLKDAGFPQKWKNGKGKIDCPCRNRGKGNIMTQSELDGSCGKDFEVYKPTLSELIEVCGKETLVLWMHNKKWFAGLRTIMTFKNSKGIVLTDTHTLVIDYEDYKIGETPEEAVAKLWLELNKIK